MADESGGNPKYPVNSTPVNTDLIDGSGSLDLSGFTKEVQMGSLFSRKTARTIGENWDKRFNYNFKIVKANADGSTSNESPFTPDGMDAGECKLDIPPQSLSIDVSFANSVVATNGGILEENNGVVFRTIVLSGTTGIYAPRGTQTSPGPSSFASVANAIFPSAVTAVNNLVSNFKKVLGTNSTFLKSEINLEKTGYYQFWKLNNFLIQYAESKKKKEYNTPLPLRLVFECPKDNISYVVTPLTFDLKKDASAPMLYRYNIVLRAWDIVTSGPKLDTDYLKDEEVSKSNPFSIKKVLNKIKQARQTIQSASGVIQGVQSDVFDIMNIYGQVILSMKDAIGVADTALDFFPTLKNNAELMVKNNKRQINQALLNLKSSSSNYDSLPSHLNAKDVLGISGTNANLSIVSNRVSDSGGAVSSSASSSGPVTGSGQKVSPTGERVDTGSTTDIGAGASLNALFSNPSAMDSIQMSEFGVLPKTINDQIEKLTAAAAATDAGIVKGLVSKLKEMSDNVATAAGMMDDTYASTYGVPKQAIGSRAPNEDDILLVAAIEESRDAFISTLASGNVFKEKQDSPFKSANSYLDTADQLSTPTSAFVVTIDRGETLERLALSTLGDATRGREIAILNNLRAPYIDEDGFTLPISLATGRTFVVQDISKLDIGQFIVIKGNILPSTRRKILNIESIGGGNYRITADGNLNLDIYVSTSSPYLQARLSGTVGSGDSILIPSEDPADDSTQSRETSLSQRLGYAERLFKVDIALDKNNDWQIASNGDAATSYGYQNAIQVLRGIVETERGELELHPFFGLDAGVGQKINTNLANTVKTRITAAILADKRFSSATVVVALEGSALLVNVVAIGRKGTGRIALQFKIAA